ncbi:MAG: polyketide synthase, partial [Pseudomonadales bacterium]|nr:polyketide synthase [Pseudomonadales bacterium]
SPGPGPRRAGLLTEVDRFDPGAFAISPREAEEMDPQQRLALELGWEAVCDAGLTRARIAATPTGVWMGASWHHYAVLHSRAGAAITGHTSTGLASNMIANRISYFLDAGGPSMVVDTACSSSLVAILLACRSLAAGETRLALAGGVSLLLDPEDTLGMERFGGLSPRGQLRPFDAEADGYVRGEGGGVVVLERLSDAIRHGDRVLALIRGGAVNNDGRSNGLTAPNQRAQVAVLRDA